MMKGEITPHAARQEWAERAPGQRRFNDQLRAQVRGGYTADTEQVMARADADGGAPVAMRDAQSGRYADLGEAARAAGSKEIPGGMVPESPPPVPSANSQIRDAYYRKQQLRGGGR